MEICTNDSENVCAGGDGFGENKFTAASGGASTRSRRADTTPLSPSAALNTPLHRATGGIKSTPKHVLTHTAGPTTSSTSHGSSSSHGVSKPTAAQQLPLSSSHHIAVAPPAVPAKQTVSLFESSVEKLQLEEAGMAVRARSDPVPVFFGADNGGSRNGRENGSGNARFFSIPIQPVSGVHCCRCCPLPFATQTWGALEIVRRSEMTFEEEDIDGVMASELASLFGADGVRGFSFREDDVSDDDADVSDDAVADSTGLPRFGASNTSRCVTATPHTSGNRNPMADLLELEEAVSATEVRNTPCLRARHGGRGHMRVHTQSCARTHTLSRAHTDNTTCTNTHCC